MIEDPAEAARQATRLCPDYDAICVHADSPNAIEIAHAVRNALIEAGTVPLGDRAIRFPRPAGSSARALLDHLRTWPGVTDVVVTREAVALYFDGEPRVERGALAQLASLRSSVDEARLVEIPAVYEGQDLADVARASGLTETEVIAAHAAATYEVETMGFAPGFAYLTGLDGRLHLPRRTTPRARVPAGSIALAGGYTAVYPFDSPGGWHIIGRVAEGVRMFDGHGARLRLGDRVRFVR